MRICARTACLVAVILAVAVSVTVAQRAGRHRGILLTFGNWGNPPVTSALGLVSAANSWSAYPTNPSGPWPYWGNVYGATQDYDNHTVIVPALVGQVSPQVPGQYALVGWNPATRTVVSTLWSGPFGIGMPQHLTNLTLNSDGDLVGYDNQLDQIMILDRSRGSWSGTSISPVPVFGGLGGFEWDRLHGGYLHASAISDAEQTLMRTSWDLKSTSVLASGVSIPAFYGGSMLEDGTWVSSSVWWGTYMEVKPSTGRWGVGPLTALGSFSDVTAEKFAAPGKGYYAAYANTYGFTQSGVVHVDATSTPHTVTTLVAGKFPNGVGTRALEVLPLHERDLATVRTGKSTWTIIVDPGLGAFASRPFVITASLAGATPPIRFPDGRQFFQVLDWLAVRTSQGPLPPFLTGNTGSLNMWGRGGATLDLTALGTKANGITIHLCAIVFDPAAPSGVAWICEPWAFVVNVRP